MKRNLLFITAMSFVLSSILSAAEPAVVHMPFDGVSLDGWKFKGGNENCWKVGNLKADDATMESLPLKGGGKRLFD